MDSESLIKEIKQYPVLYDQNHAKYRNTDYKDRIWRDISISVGAKGGVAECKRKWSSIRDQYRKIIFKRRKIGNKTSARNKKYIYENILSFLNPYIVNKETGVSILEASDEETIKEAEHPEKQDSNVQKTRACQKPQKPGLLARKRMLSRPLKKIRSNVEKELASNQLMAYILEEKRAKETEAAEKHPVDAFLAGIAPTLKTLSPVLLNQVKTKIFSVVQEFEMRELMCSQEFDQESMSSYISTSLQEGEIILEEVGDEDFKGCITQLATIEEI